MLRGLDVQECDTNEPNQGVEVGLIKKFYQGSKI